MYTLTIWAVLSGLVVFGEIPNTLAIAGMVLVALAGLAIIWIDGRQRKASVILSPTAAEEGVPG
jgi:drug/metabolite transporter (DMT)-like permease